MADSRRIADEVLAGIPGRAEISFAYGQGSAFMEFADVADVDMVIVWSRLSTEELRIGKGVVRRFEGTTYALDKLEAVDVLHLTVEALTGWCDEVADGRGWRDEVWPLPLHVVAGLAEGVMLVDRDGVGARLTERMRRPSEQFVAEVVGSLSGELEGNLTELQACVRRDDHWLFGRLTDRLVRHCYIAWFALEGFHCPFPKHLDEWVGRLGLDGAVARLERAVWEGRLLGERAGAVERFARAVLAAG
jgi:hypothetical protein